MNVERCTMATYSRRAMVRHRSTTPPEIHRVLHSFSLVPTYNLPGELCSTTPSRSSANYTENRDLNKFSVGQTDVKTLALGAYNLNVKPRETNFTFSLSHQNTKGLQFGVLLPTWLRSPRDALPQGRRTSARRPRCAAQLQRGAPPLQEPLHGRLKHPLERTPPKTPPPSLGAQYGDVN